MSRCCETEGDEEAQGYPKEEKKKDRIGRHDGSEMMMVVVVVVKDH